MPPAPIPPRPDVSAVSEGWLNGIPHDPNDPDWSTYDTDIVAATKAYNEYLAKQAGYLPLDPLFVKAMCWTETGAASSAWDSRPMQIGNAGDAGLAELLSRKPACLLVLPPAFQRGGMYELTSSNVRTQPVYNIRAGIGYLLLRASTFVKTTVFTDKGEYFDDTVQKRDTLTSMSRRDSTTIQELKDSNPPEMTRRLKPNTTLRFRHTAIQESLSFKRITTYQAASTYNNNAVTEYQQKLDYCMWVLSGGAQAADEAASKEKK